MTTLEQRVRAEDTTKVGWGELAYNIRPDHSYPKFPTLYQTIPYPVLHLSVVGSHAYGCASDASDVDIHGIYVLPEDDVLGLETPKERYAREKEVVNGYTIDLVTYDLKKALKLLLGDTSNGNILEMLYSPCRLMVTPEYWQLRTLVQASITRHASKHYHHFAIGEWNTIINQVAKNNEVKVKSLIHCYRLLLTGIHLMKTGQVEVHIPTLTETYLCPLLTNAVNFKQTQEDLTIPWGVSPNTTDFLDTYYTREYTRLQTMLQDATDESHLPDSCPEARVKLNAFLVRVRKEFAPY